MNGQQETSFNAVISELCAAGLYLVRIPSENGKPTKAPKMRGWNNPHSPQNLNGYSKDPLVFIGCDDYNVGLYHEASITLALDLDDLEQSQKLFESVTEFDLLDWLSSDLRFEIKSPRLNRRKLLFKLPAGFSGSGLRQFRHQKQVIFELRSGNCQDVIYGHHPEGGPYKFIGNPLAIPIAPQVLLDMMQNWDEWHAFFDSELGKNQPLPKIISPQPLLGGQLPSSRDPIREFNQMYGVADVLLRNGYRQKGVDRFIRPGSTSQAPGAVIMRDCADGIDRIYSHGGDSLNDGFAHSAFDCFCLLEHDGNLDKALGWNYEITKHNQQLFRQSQATGTQKATKQICVPLEKPIFPLISALQLTAKPVVVDWIVENIIERGSMNLLFGEPGACKSLFMLDWAFCVAAGLYWNGFQTQQTDVVVVAGEGFAGMARRLKALETKYNHPAPKRLLISQRPAQLLDENNAKWLADAIKDKCPNPGLVIIDTLHRNMNGDENSSQDIGRFIQNLDIFLKPLGAAILIVHHSGHGQKDRARGSSSIKAAMDAEYSATKKGNTICLKCTKAKDFEEFAPMQFALKSTNLDWLGSDGVPLTSVYLDNENEVLPKLKKPELSAREKAFLISLREAVAEVGIETSAEIKAKFDEFESFVGKKRKIVNIDDWKERAFKIEAIDACTDDAKRMAFNRCRTKFLVQGIIGEYDNSAWLIESS